jgi:hypothetical protein
VPVRRLDTRRLNRTLLERQLLLRRRRIPPLEAVERLVGLQAQVPRDPYVGLWSRLDRFRPESLADAVTDRRAVRMPLLRATLHLVTDRDALSLRPALEPVLQRTLHSQSPFGKRLAGVDVDELLRLATALLEEQPRTRAELAPLLAERWPTHDGPSLAYAVTYLLPLVQVTPRGVWGHTGRSAFTTVEHWLGRPLGPVAAPDEMVLRYLAVFGPATPADVQAWSGLQAVRELMDRLRPQLRVFRDARDRELFDVSGAALPHPDTPAPVRFLPEYDNVLLGHADRGRIVAPGLKPWTEVGWGMVLVDGFTAARWTLDRDKDRATLRVEPFSRLSPADRDEVTLEGTRLTGFLARAARQDVRVA